MPGDVETALAFVSRREGRRSIARSRWAHLLSLDLGWMSPAEATAFVERAVAAGILRPSAGDGLELSFDPDLAPAALGFRPDPRAVAANAPAGRPDVFLDHLALLQRATGLDRKACMDRVAARQAEAGGMLSATAAVLWLCAEAKVDVRHAAGQVKP